MLKAIQELVMLLSIASMLGNLILLSLLKKERKLSAYFSRRAWRFECQVIVANQAMKNLVKKSGFQDPDLNEIRNAMRRIKNG